MAFGHSCIRTLMIVFNSLFLLCGIGLVGVGVWITIDFSELLKFLPADLSSNKSLVQGVGISVAVIGGLTIFQAALGCIGAWRESKCLLTMFFVIMFIVLAIVLTAAVIILIHQDWVKNLISKTMQYETDHDTEDGFLKFANSAYNCCGIVDEPTCSKNYPPIDKCHQNSTSCTNGCLEAVWSNMFVPYLDAGVGVLFGLSVVVALGTVFGIGLCCSIRRRDETFAYHTHHDHHHQHF